MLYLIEIEHKGLFRYLIENYDKLDKVDMMIFLESLETMMYRYDMGGKIEEQIVEDITRKLIEQARVEHPDIMKHTSD